MPRHLTFRDFTLCQAFLLAALVGIGFAAARGEGLHAGTDADDVGFHGGQVQFIDWDCQDPPVFAPMI